ncbi:hypothetical protein, partial [Staphylococcus pseudintermedius]
SLSQVTSNGSTTKEDASTFVSTVDSLKGKASNNGTPSEFASVVKSVHGSMSTSASTSASASTSTSEAVSTEASEFVSAVDSLSQVTSNGSTTKEDAS